MAVEEEEEGGANDIVRRRDESRRLTVEDRADLWEWFEEFVEDFSMDVAKVGGAYFFLFLIFYFCSSLAWLELCSFVCNFGTVWYGFGFVRFH